VLPQEYVQTMRESMLKRCPVSSYEEVRGVFKKEIGELPETVFAEFDPVPIASASLAQVHAATTHDGKKVAVKVQHDHLLDTSVIDIATVDLVVNALNYIFPTFDYRWLVDEIRESAPKELDFLCEAQNSERCLVNFRKLSPHIANSIYTPKVYWNLSTSRILTMEYIDAKEVTDVKGIKDLGIRPVDVSNLVNKAFAEMIFKHGFVHCDPHAANMMIRPLPQDSKKWFG
uniref:ABC1 atypical kinase-like domain-containing protein n=3 Tax=Aegilops tauschii TaxID=37682 RepID=A0A453H524_AEGTS